MVTQHTAWYTLRHGHFSWGTRTQVRCSWLCLLLILIIFFAACTSSPTVSIPTPTRTPTRPPDATGIWRGTKINLSPAAHNVAVESLPDAAFQGRIDQFHSSDPTLSCFNTTSLNVWVAPKEFPGVYVVHSKCPDGTQGTWVFIGSIPLPAYSAQWLTQTVNLSYQEQNVVIQSLPDQQYQGLVSNFTTNNSRFFCLVGTSLNVWTALGEYKPPQGTSNLAEYIVQSRCSDGTEGTWTFLAPPPIPGPPPIYTALWQGKKVTLAFSPLPSPTHLIATGQQVTMFYTDSSTYQCFVAAVSYNVYQQMGGSSTQYWVYDECPRAIYGSWTFIAAPLPSPTP
jgi:hypothetical protein